MSSQPEAPPEGAPAPAAAPGPAPAPGAPDARLGYSDALIDGLPSGILIIDRDYRIQRVNRYLATWLRREPEAMLGRHCYDLVHARETPCLDCPCAVAFSTGEPATVVHTGLDAHGGTTHAEIVALPIRDASGKVVLALESARDVSERERHLAQLAAAVEGLQASQALLQRRNEELELLNGLLVRTGYAMGLDAVVAAMLAGALRLAGGRASGALFLLDEQGRRLHLAATQGPEAALVAPEPSVALGEGPCGAAALTGRVVVATGGDAVAVPLVSSDHVLGVLALRLPADQPPRAGLEPLLELMGRQMGMAIQNAQLYQRTDAQLHAKVAELTRALATVEQERSRAQASERAKEEFVSMVSHDLRSPLSVILSDASDYGRTCRDEACQASRASTRGAVRRASAMLTELVDSARLESGALVLRRDRLDLVALLRELAGTGFPAEERARLRLTGDLPAAPLLGDRGWLERAIGNVLGNALKFAPAASPVAVRLARQASAWRLEVIDLGPGIPAAELPLLFNRYFRASNAQWTAGSGLGLYITRLVVEALGGQVEVASELGRGTTVALTLPAFPGGSAGG